MLPGLVSSPSRELGASLEPPDIPRALQGAFLVSTAANSSPVAKGKREGKEPFLCKPGT